MPLDDCWLAPDVVVAASPIASNGLFASADIAAGTVISRLGGRLVSSAELERRPPRRSLAGRGDRPTMYVDPARRGGRADGQTMVIWRVEPKGAIAPASGV